MPQGFNVAILVLLLVVIVVCVFPFYWMVTTSFKEQAAILSPDSPIFFHPTLENYTMAFQKFDIRRQLGQLVDRRAVDHGNFVVTRSAGGLRYCPLRI